GVDCAFRSRSITLMICQAPGRRSLSSSFGLLQNIHSAGRSNDVSYTPAYRMKGKFRLLHCKDSRATYAPGQRLVWGSMREAGLAGFYETPASGPDAGEAVIFSGTTAAHIPGAKNLFFNTLFDTTN